MSVHALQAATAGMSCEGYVSLAACAPLPPPDARLADRDRSGREASPVPRQGAEGTQNQAKTRRDGDGGAPPRDRFGYSTASLPRTTAQVRVQAPGLAAWFCPDAFAPQGLMPEQGGQTGPPEDCLHR
ncbi:MAG: hypothetical protein HXX12_08875 [Geothrix sp.]|nr:hypothetical protein [Geothrix sp.]